MTDWLSSLNTIIMSILTLVYVAATILILRANRSSVLEMQKTREEEYRPYVVVYFARHHRVKNAIMLVVKNISKTIAKDVVIRTEPAIDKPNRRPLSKSKLLTRAIPDLPPNYEITAFVGQLMDLKQNDGTYPEYNFYLSYKDQQNKKFNDEYHSSLNTEAELLYFGDKTMHDLVEEFESFNGEFNRKMGNLLEVMSANNMSDKTKDREMTLQDLPIGFNTQESNK